MRSYDHRFRDRRRRKQPVVRRPRSLSPAPAAVGVNPKPETLHCPRSRCVTHSAGG